jgi:hypothetical protein
MARVVPALNHGPFLAFYNRVGRMRPCVILSLIHASLRPFLFMGLEIQGIIDSTSQAVAPIHSPMLALCSSVHTSVAPIRSPSYFPKKNARVEICVRGCLV